MFAPHTASGGSGAPDANQLFVGNIAYACTESDLRGLFSKFGTVLSVRIMFDNFGQNRGFAYVDFLDIESCKLALSALQGQMFMKRNLKLDWAFAEHRAKYGGGTGGPTKSASRQASYTHSFGGSDRSQWQESAGKLFYSSSSDAGGPIDAPVPAQPSHIGIPPTPLPQDPSNPVGINLGGDTARLSLPLRSATLLGDGGLHSSRSREEEESTKFDWNHDAEMKIHIARLLHTMSTAQLIYIVGHFQRFSIQYPDSAWQLLAENVPFAYSILYAMFLLDLVTDDFLALDPKIIASTELNKQERQLQLKNSDIQVVHPPPPIAPPVVVCHPPPAPPAGYKPIAEVSSTPSAVQPASMLGVHRQPPSMLTANYTPHPPPAAPPPCPPFHQPPSSAVHTNSISAGTTSTPAPPPITPTTKPVFYSEPTFEGKFAYGPPVGGGLPGITPYTNLPQHHPPSSTSLPLASTSELFGDTNARNGEFLGGDSMLQYNGKQQAPPPSSMHANLPPSSASASITPVLSGGLPPMGYPSPVFPTDVQYSNELAAGAQFKGESTQVPPSQPPEATSSGPQLVDALDVFKNPQGTVVTNELIEELLKDYNAEILEMLLSSKEEDMINWDPFQRQIVLNLQKEIRLHHSRLFPR